MADQNIFVAHDEFFFFILDDLLNLFGLCLLYLKELLSEAFQKKFVLFFLKRDLLELGLEIKDLLDHFFDIIIGFLDETIFDLHFLLVPDHDRFLTHYFLFHLCYHL
eukprot:GHVR01156853.1.p1 GENE.GHVR01156853.1~~GHVR01156853.1.p1  ORF type:complete len:107 (-),score=7.13 GHVR01156853.1:305-625(-)